MSRKIPSDEAAIHNTSIRSAFAVFWNLSLQKMPKEVIDDFENSFISTETPRAHGKSTGPLLQGGRLLRLRLFSKQETKSKR